MNKIFVFILLSAIFSLAAHPQLEVREFGKKSPSVQMKLFSKKEIFSGDNWNCQVIKKSSKVNTWNFEFKSSSNNPIRLAIKFSLPLGFKPYRFWDGLQEIKVNKLPLSRADFLEAFPLAVAENGTLGKALGFAPENILSQFNRTLTNNALILECRIVVDNRKVQKLVITEFDFIPEFSWRNAVEIYQDAFSSYFTPVKGVDKRIYGVGGYLSGAHKQRAFQLHSSRFSKIQWEWTYAPWYESGNWYPVGEGWKTNKNEFRNYHKIHSHAMVTKSEYDNALKQQLYYGNKSAAMFYYILVKDIHQNVAKDYPQAVKSNSGLHSLPSNKGKTKAVFAPGTPLFDYLKKQLKQVVDNYDVSGFSFDMANSSYHFSTPSQLEYAVGRSWYDDGQIYTSDSVTPIPFADYVHTLKKDGKRMGAIFNAALSKFSPFTMFRSDAAIMEGPPHYNYSMVMPLRLILGRKPFIFWHFNPSVSDGIKNDLISNDPVEKAKVNLGLKQFYLLKCYELGANPMNWETIDDFWYNHLPVLRALSEAGYHPVSAIKNAEPFWTGRFGNNSNTILTISNPKNTTITRTIKIINRYIGSSKYAFLPTKGNLKQKLVNGQTIFQLTLKPKEIFVLRTIELKGDVTEFTAGTNNLTISLNSNKAFNYTFPAIDFYGNGIFQNKNGLISGKANKVVKLVMQPACGIFGNSSAMVKMLDKDSNPEIEVGNTQEGQTIAEMVAMYRPHVKASMLFNGKINNRTPGFMNAALCKADLKITAIKKAKSGKKICIGTPEDFPEFNVPKNCPPAFLAMPNANTLWIGGKTIKDLHKAADTYFTMLDKSQATKVKVDVKQPTRWGGDEKFIQKTNQKYLQIIGDPSKKKNKWRYQWYPISGVKGGDEISFTSSCKLEKLSAGKVQIGVYEFSDEKGSKALKFNSIEVKASPNWQSISGKVKLNPKTKVVRFYFLCRNLGKNDIFLVRSLELSIVKK